MRLVSTTIALGALSALSLADVFTLSLGDVKQYSTSLAATPTLTGSRIVFTDAASPNDGVDVVLSEDLRANIKKTFDTSCKTVDNQCVGNMKALLINPHTELESRQIIVGAAGALALLLAILLPSIEEHRSKGIPIALHLPSAQLAPAASAAEAATVAVISTSGTPFVTVVPNPPPTSVPGPDKPTETILSSPQDGHASGDFAIHLSADLARRISEIIDRSQQCAAGNANPGAKVAQLNDLSVKVQAGDATAIKCAAKAVVLNSFPGGPFSDLSSITGDQPGWSSPDMADVVTSVTGFALAQYKSLGGTAAGATTLAIAAVYIAYVQIRSRTPLGTVNWISGGDLKGTMSVSPTTIMATTTMMITTTSTASSSSMLECSASCAMIGRIRNCNTWCPTPTEDSYTRPTEYAVKTVAFEPWHVPKTQKPIKAPIGVCPAPPNNATDFPLDSFKDVYSQFCNHFGNSTASTVWVVDAKGNQAGPISRLSRFIRRAVSADGDKYKGYLFTLSRVVRGGGAPRCSTTCAAAYEQLSHLDMCKRGDDKKSIADTGFLDAGCASYSFSIQVPKPPEVKADIQCRDSNGHFSAPKYHTDGTPSVETAIKDWCTANDQTYLNSASDERYGRYDIVQLGVPKRSSFWPRVNLADPTKKGVVVKEQCMSAFTDGLKQCDPNSARTHGFTAVVGTANYSLDLSGLTTEGNPPWLGDKMLSFPPSEFQSRYNSGGKDNSEPWGVECDPVNPRPGRVIHQEDLEKAISFFCVNGNALKDLNEDQGRSGLTAYPPKGQPQFYQDDKASGFTTHLAMGAEALNLKGDKAPYWDKRSCDGYDWKLGEHDCRYAFRKMLNHCNTKDDRFNAGFYKYRCVHYRMFAVNLRM